MTVEPSWRIVDGVCRDPSEYWKLRELEEAGSLPAHIRAWTAEYSDMFTVPDTRLQAIADTWNELPGGQCYAVRIAAGKLVAAIEDALTENDDGVG